MKSVYVYYRIDPAQAGAAADQIDALLRVMTPYCGQPPHRLQRCDEPTMWMEIYADIADFAAFTSALDRATRTCDCGAFTQGERHLECFSMPLRDQ